MNTLPKVVTIILFACDQFDDRFQFWFFPVLGHLFESIVHGQYLELRQEVTRKKHPLWRANGALKATGAQRIDLALHRHDQLVMFRIEMDHGLFQTPFQRVVMAYIRLTVDQVNQLPDLFQTFALFAFQLRPFDLTLQIAKRFPYIIQDVFPCGSHDFSLTIVKQTTPFWATHLKGVAQRDV